MKTCSQCKLLLPLDRYSQNGKRLRYNCKDCQNKAQARWREADRENARASTRRTYAKTKSLAFDRLGRSCVRCGFDDERALQIDHVEGGGCRESSVIGSYGILRKVADGADGYQVLCANCNWIKRVENNETAGALDNGRELREVML